LAKGSNEVKQVSSSLLRTGCIAGNARGLLTQEPELVHCDADADQCVVQRGIADLARNGVYQLVSDLFQAVRQVGSFFLPEFRN
jgi:hypothetical protein